MGLIAYPVAGKQKSVDICKAFIDGAPRDAVGHVFYGVNASNVAEFRVARARGEPWFYIDNSYFDAARGRQFRVTRNALQHDGLGESDGKRFDALGVKIKPWRLSGKHIVVCPQSDSFMAHVMRYPGSWLAQQLASLVDHDVRVRAWNRDKLKSQATLLDDLRDALLLITHSSAAAVTAIIEGVPVQVAQESCAYSQPYMAPDGERYRWASVLADNQWTLDEMREGKAWSWLTRN
jgi:hypothetical protein